MKLFAIAAASALLLAGTAANAQAVSPWYGEVGITRLDTSGGNIDTNPYALRGIVGYDLHPFVGLEGMAAVGIKRDSAFDGAENVDVKLKNSIGLFVKPKFSPTNNVEVFGRLGWVRSKVEGCGSISGCGSSSDSGAAFGLGANYRFNPKMHVGLDYMRYFNDNGFRVNGLTVSVGYRF